MGTRPQVNPSGGADLCFVIPARNEAPTVEAVVRACREAGEALGSRHGVTVVSDGSTDGTAAAARNAGASVIERMAPNGSKAEALKMGVAATSARWVFFVDGDCVGLAANHLLSIAAPVLAGEARMGVGVFDYPIVRGLVQRVPWSSGERLLDRDLIAWDDPRLSGYNIEILINEAIGLEGSETVSSIMTGVRQRNKLQKRGIIHGVLGDLRMWRNIARSVSAINLPAYRAYMLRVRLNRSDKANLHHQSASLVTVLYLFLRLATTALQPHSALKRRSS